MVGKVMMHCRRNSLLFGLLAVDNAMLYAC